MFSYVPSGLSSIPALFRGSEQGSLWWQRIKDAGYQALIMSPRLFLVRCLCWFQMCLFAHSKSWEWLASSSCPTLASCQDWVPVICCLMYAWWESSGGCVLGSYICWPRCHGHLPCLQPSLSVLFWCLHTQAFPFSPYLWQFWHF